VRAGGSNDEPIRSLHGRDRNGDGEHHSLHLCPKKIGILGGGKRKNKANSRFGEKFHISSNSLL
jgi:hypothetical protein